MLSNVKVAFIRPSYNNLKEWMEDRKNFYIGRPGIVFVDVDGAKTRWPLANSKDTFGFKFANKHKLPKNPTLDDFRQVLANFEKDLEEMLKDSETLEQFKSLKGKNLGCWCVNCQHKSGLDYKTVNEKDFEKYGLCHGDVILRKLENL